MFDPEWKEKEEVIVIGTKKEEHVCVHVCDCV